MRVILLMEGVGKAKLIKIHALAKKHNCPVLEALGYISEVGFNEKLRQRLSSFKSLVSRDKLHPIKAFVSFFDYSNRIKADDNAKDKMENINALIDMFSGYDYDAGGIVAFTLLPSGSLESSNGLFKSTLLPTSLAILFIKS